MDHMHNNMSVTYVTTKRKISRPQLKPNTQVPKALDRDIESGGIGPSKIEACSQKTQNIKRTYARKKYHDLQPVFMSPTGVPASESSPSCSVIASSLINGTEESHMGPMGHMAYRMPGRESCCQGMESTRGTGYGMKRKQPIEEPCRSPTSSLPGVIRESVLVVERTDSSHLVLPSEEPRPRIFTTKKEPPTYPPGSQEERWQLQILGKGRVTCPKCKSVGRKTVEGLKKHMEACNMHPFTCPHCGKQLKSSTGMKYHLMADHNNLPSLEEGNGMDDQALKEKLRKILKRMGKLKCSKEGCSGSFTSIMGYLYHTKKCGKEESELEKLLLNCKHCGKPYRSRAGLEYHLKSEHAPTPQKTDEDETKTQQEPSPERTPSGRVKRMSAQVAVYHLQEIANDELSKEWPKRKVQRDLVPDDKKLKYARPGLPAFSQEVLRKWKNEVKLQRKVLCPNQGCGAVYTSVSGLKAHLGLCTMGEFEAGKYKCLICRKEFNSESGVKYHINSVHSQEWFVVSKKGSKNFEKLLKTKPRLVGSEPPPEQNQGLCFTPGLSTWEEMGPLGAPSSVIMANPGAAEAEGKRQEEREKDGEKEREPGQEQEQEQGRGKDCYEFEGSDNNNNNSSSSSGGSSSSGESEAEDAVQTGHDTWALKRPSIADPHHALPPPPPPPAKLHRANP